MPDPFEELRELSAGLPARPLPASEVRRRGDRMRRRRNALQAAGAGVAVAVLASSGLLVGENMTGTGPPPRPATQAPSPTASATAPQGGWVTEIPDAFPLGAGLPEPEPTGDVPPWSTSDAVDVAWSLLPCADPDTGQSTFPSDSRRTDSSFIFVQSPTRSQVRHLVVYEDGRAAATAVEEILGQARACGPETLPGGTDLRWDVSVSYTFGGSEAWLVNGRESSPTGSEVLLALLRTGNAVLVARVGDVTAAEDTGGPSEPTVDEWAGQVTRISDAMCVFSVTGCTTSEGPRPEDDRTGEPSGDARPTVTRIPDGFDLGLGIPAPDGDSERTTSTRRSTPFAFDPCHNEGGHLTGPARTDFAEVVQTVPAGAYVHQLAVYLDEGAADEAMGVILQDLEACSTYAYPDGTSEDRWTQLDSDATRFGADGAVVAVNHAYTGGMRTTLASHHIAVRVGNAVLVVTRHGEFGAAPDDAGTVAVDTEQRRVAAELVAQMCPFAGPSSELDCAAADGSSTGLATLDPGGLGPIRLGMSGADLEGTGLVTFEDGHGTSCTTYAVLGSDRVLARGSISEEFGVESIAIDKGVSTPEGITLGSTIEEVRTSYAHLVGGETRMSATASDTAAYWFDLTDGVVTGLRLELTAHAC